MGRRILPPIIHELLLTELDTLDAYQGQLPSIDTVEVAEQLLPLMRNHERRAKQLERLIKASGDVSIEVGHFEAPHGRLEKLGASAETLAAFHVLRDAEYACDIAWKAACSAVTLNIPENLIDFLETEARRERADMENFEHVLTDVRAATRMHEQRLSQNRSGVRH